MLLHWHNGPLFVQLRVADNGHINLDTMVKYYDSHRRHHFFLRLKDGPVTKQQALVERYLCPRCTAPLYMDYADQYNVLGCCGGCGFDAWSDKLLDVSDDCDESPYADY